MRSQSKPMIPFTCDFSRALGKLKVIARSCLAGKLLLVYEQSFESRPKAKLTKVGQPNQDFKQLQTI